MCEVILVHGSVHACMRSVANVTVLAAGPKGGDQIQANQEGEQIRRNPEEGGGQIRGLPWFLPLFPQPAYLL